MTLTLTFCGDSITPGAGRPFSIGRDADLVIDDNPFLHRRFLTVDATSGVWVLANVGDQLAATVSDSEGRLEAFLAPGAVLPIVFPETLVRFTAGPTTYEIGLHLADPVFQSSPMPLGAHEAADTTIGRVSLTPDQHLMVLALAESALRSAGGASAVLPTSGQAAARLGWTTTKFNRKLDNVCDKLTKLGVRGLHGGVGDSASNRRARLVEYALAVRLVDSSQLTLLEGLELSE